MGFFDSNFLFASLIWGSIGVGFFIYGRKQQSVAPLVAGILMIAASYFASSAMVMSLVCIGLMAVLYIISRQG